MNNVETMSAAELQRAIESGDLCVTPTQAIAELVRRAEALEELYVEPCHITGTHDPSHTPRYTCESQLVEIVKRMCKRLGLSPKWLPREVHEDCYWCHDDPAREAEYVEWAKAGPQSLEEARNIPEELDK